MKKILAFTILILIGCSNAPQSKPKETEKPEQREAVPTLKFKIMIDIYYIGEIQTEQIKIQSLNDKPVQVSAISANRKKEWTRVWYNGGRLGKYGMRDLPLELEFGETIYAGAFSEQMSSGVVEVSIRTNQGDFVTQDIKYVGRGDVK